MVLEKLHPIVYFLLCFGQVNVQGNIVLSRHLNTAVQDLRRSGVGRVRSDGRDDQRVAFPCFDKGPRRLQ